MTPTDLIDIRKRDDAAGELVPVTYDGKGRPKQYPLGRACLDRRLLLEEVDRLQGLLEPFVRLALAVPSDAVPAIRAEMVQEATKAA